MMRVSWLLVMLMTLILSATALAESDKIDPTKLYIERDGPLLTVKAKEVPHRQILEGIAKQLHFELIIDGLLEEQYSLDLGGIPWEEALRKALFPANWAFVYASAAKEPRLIKVFVLQPPRDKNATGDLPAVPSRADTPSLASTQPSEAQASEAPEPEQKGVNASLTKLLKAEDEIVRVAAVNSIALVGGEKAGDCLETGTPG